MSVCRVHRVDPKTRKIVPREELPQIFDVIVQQKYRGSDPDYLIIHTEPLTEFLKRNHVDGYEPCD